MSKLLEGRDFYKPFQYPWAYDLYKKSEQMHWLPEEVDFREDIDDWNTKISAEEKSLLTNLFRFFTQGDIDVAAGYREVYMPYLGKHPEVGMMMMSFAAREAVHIDAYSQLIETVGMPESTYEDFAKISEMADKHDYVTAMHFENTYDRLLGLAVYSAFTEGMMLFSSFAILMNFERHNKMKGMANIVRWSIKDETLHVDGMTRLFKELHNEYNGEWQSAYIQDRPHGSPNRLKQDIERIAIDMVNLEDAFIDLCFEHGDIEGLTADDIKQYIRYICNRRWNQLGYSGEVFEGATNPLKWLDWVINGKEHANFFESRPTEYSKGTVVDTEEMQW